MGKRRVVPSPAMVVAVTALVMALSGTGYAASQLASSAKSHKKSDKSTDTKLVKGVVNKLAPSLKVGFATAAGTASTASNATNLGGKPSTAYEAAGFESHWGNITIAPGGSQAIGTWGPFTLTAKCTSGGAGEYQLSSTVTAYVYGEDGPYPGNLVPGTPQSVATDEDSDEAFEAWAPSTGTTINGTPFNWQPHDNGSVNVGPNCEFQGVVYKTS